MRALATFFVAAATGLALTFGAASATADTTDVTCTDNAAADQLVLQPALNGADPGDTIVISGLCAGSYQLYDGSAFTLEGAAGQTDGFDGQGTAQSDSLLFGSQLGAMTVQNLTFENAVEPDTNDPSALYLQVGAGGSLTLTGDSFKANSDLDMSPEEIDDDSGVGTDGCSSSPASITINDSQFTDNTLNQDGFDPYDLVFGGAGLSLYLTCESSSVSLSGNTFSGNVISNGPSTNQPGTGAGLSIFAATPDGSDSLVPVMQSNNTFSANAIDAPADDSADFFDGAGEAAMGVALQSHNDKFIDNVLPGSDPNTGFYWGSSGAGLFLGGSCSNASQATLAQDVVGDNVITMSSTSGDSADAANGAGVAIGEDPVLDYYYFLGDYYGGDEGYYYLGDEAYAFLCGDGGFGPSNSHVANGPADNADLNLNDSTVTGNAVIDDGSPAASDSGAVAGIDAPDGGSLELDNTILDGDVGGSEADGFIGQQEGNADGPSRSLGVNGLANPPEGDSQITATYSDFCDPSNPSSPFPGTGNICADPQLVTDGYSPPSDLGSDGENAGPAISASPSATAPNMEETSSSPTIDAGSNALVPDGITTDIYANARELAKSCPISAGTVDIGAAEYVPTCTISPPPSTPTPTPTPAPTPQPSKVVQACASLRDIVIHLQYTFSLSSPDLIRSASATLTSTTVAGFGSRQLSVFGPHHNEVRLNLRTLPRGTYLVHAHVTLTDGRQGAQVREWHTCRPFHWHYKPGKPRKIHWH